MIPFFTDIFTYHHYTNQNLCKQLIEHQEILSERTIPLFSHIINAQQIWNTRIIKGTQRLAVFQVHTLEECQRLDDENYHQTLQILNELKLDNEILYRNSQGEEYRNSIQEILFHIANHHTHHRGQIISDLRQSNIDPIKTDYIFYKRL